MELIHAAILLHEAGKEVSEDNLKKLMSSVGIHKSEAEIKTLIVALEGVNIDEAIKQSALPVVAAPVQQAHHVAKEEHKEEPKEAAAGLGSLFG